MTPTPPPVAADAAWLTPMDLASLADMDYSKALAALRQAMNGKPWRASTLAVRLGAGTIQVRADTLPPDLAALWWDLQGTPEPLAPVAEVGVDLDTLDADAACPRRHQVALWRLALLRPALDTPRGSAARRRWLEAIAATRHQEPDGALVTYSVSGLRDWLRRYESAGLAGLAPKPRKDRGVGRTNVTRAWDSAAGMLLSEEARAQVGEALTRYIRSAWGAGAGGWREVADLASSRLVELSREAGMDLPDAALHPLCGRSSTPAGAESLAGLRRRVEAERRYAVVHKQASDAKAFQDLNMPRIRRTRAGMLPLDLVVGDVTPLDIYLQRPDGSIVTPKAIAWLDVATNRLWVSLYVPPPGRGVTRMQVAASFASMCQHWGLPGRLYLDNGSEYSWAEMLGGFSELSRLTKAVKVALLSDAPAADAATIQGARDEVTRARPYNAAAKPIEGIFSALNVIVSMLPGYVGGNRMTKKSANVGRAPVPFPGSPADFHAAFAVALGHYHNKPQSGSLANRSPRAAYQAAIDAGWARTACGAETLLLAFADEESRRVTQGYVQWTPARGETLYYTHERLIALADNERTVRVRVARHDPRFAFVFKSGSHRLLCVATPDQAYHPLDQAGAKEQSRRAGGLRRWVAALRQDCDLLDLVAEMARSDAHRPAMPTAPIGATITPAGELAEMLAAVDAAARAALAQAAPRPDTLCLSQWGTAGATDPYLDAVSGWDD